MDKSEINTEILFARSIRLRTDNARNIQQSYKALIQYRAWTFLFALSIEPVPLSEF